VRCASRRAAPVFRSSQQKFFLKEIQDDSADNKRADRPWRFDKVGIVGHLSRAGGPCKTASAASFNNLICKSPPRADAGGRLCAAIANAPPHHNFSRNNTAE
jgi:hypothetical protein